MPHINLCEVRTDDKPARFSADGKRISRAEFYAIKERATRLECFHTKAKQLPGGKFKRWNYSVAIVPSREG